MSSEINEISLENEDDVIQALEAVLFAAGHPLEFDRLAETFEISVDEVKELIFSLRHNFEKNGSGLQIIIFSDSAQMCTKEKYEKYIREALGIKQSGKLSASSLEVLAIVAYNQPVTKAVIEQIRGVDSTYAISSLKDKNLIEVKGCLDVIGKPNLYGTTADFLRCFGLSDIKDLPNTDLKNAEPEQTTLNL